MFKLLDSRFHGSDKLGIVRCCLLFLIYILIFSGCSDRSKQESKTDNFKHNKYNILLITVDTLRSDYVSCIKKDLKMKTENIDSIAGSGVVFENSNCQSSWTLPSVVSLLTSLYPAVHHAGEPISDTSQISLVPKSLKGLPVILKNNSYTTAAFTTNVFLSSAFLFGDNFETFINYSNQEDASEKITKNAIQFLKQKRMNPFFLWLHYLDPHEYHTYLKIDINKDYDGRFTKEKLDWDKLKVDAYRLNEMEREYILSRYLGNIKYFDQQAGAVIGALKELNLDNNTLIVFTSDHGEEFWEHGRIDHGQTAYEEVLKVPLIFSLRGVLPAGKKILQLVELVDVVPTILDLCGISSDEPMQGISLLPLLADPDISFDRFAFSEGTLYGENIMSIQNRKYKLIYYTVSKRYQFYDLTADPQEQKNIFSPENKTAGMMREKLSEWIKDNKKVSIKVLGGEKVAPAVIDKDTKESLKSLGYIM
jgi:arylsulfatase A-like enzyme